MKTIKTIVTYTAFSTPSKGPFSPSKFLEINSTEHAPYSIVNYRVTLMILSPVLSIPSCPAGPFSEILEIKIPCKKRNKLWILPQRQKKSPSILHQNRNSTTEKTQTAEENVIKHDLLSYLVISHIRSRTFSTGNIDSKAFVVPVDRVFNLQRKEQYSRHS